MLHKAVRQGECKRLARLLGRGANPRQIDHLGRTALHYAQSLPAAQMLVDAGADLAIKGSKGPFDRTPLEYAQENGRADIARILRNRT